MSNVIYKFSSDGKVGYGILSNGVEFKFSQNLFYKIKDINFYINKRKGNKNIYIIDSKGNMLHRYFMKHIDGLEIDHINMDTFDNRLENLRYCTHQQNQINQGLQKNNKSGVVGVSFYKPRNKFRARIKVSQKDIHLGYYDTFNDAVKARNVAMRCMFGQYGRYNSVDEVPIWIQNKVINKCAIYSDLSDNSAFFDFWRFKDEQSNIR